MQCALTPPRAEPPPFPLNDLHTDILALIFSFAPSRARLRALSIVCKRWRTAALRAVRRLVFKSCPADEGSSDHLAELARQRAAVALLPALCSMRIKSYRLLPLLPPVSLRELELALGYGCCAQLLQAHSDATLLSTHFPHLTRCKIVFQARDRDITAFHGLLSLFSARHHTSLTVLKLRALDAIDSLVAELAKVSWPHLRKLTLRPVEDTTALEALLGAAPRIERLALLLCDTRRILRVPPARLASLQSVTLRGESTPVAELSAYLKQLPRLTEVRGKWCFREIIECGAWRRDISLTSSQTPSEAVADVPLLHPNLRHLSLTPEWVPLAANWRLPRLSSILLQSTEAAQLLSLAVPLLDAFPGLGVLTFSFNQCDEPEHFIDVLAQICAHAAQRGLRELRVRAPSDWPSLEPPAVRFGWVRLKRLGW